MIFYLSSVLNIQQTPVVVTALIHALETPCSVFEPGLRERLSALPLGALKKGRGKAGARRVVRPSFNDLGGLRLGSETRLVTVSPWIHAIAF